MYLYEGQNSVNANYLTVSPSSITSNISASFLRKPKNVKWSYLIGNLGQYIYDNSPNSQNFELHASEQTEVITRILLYSGVIIRDPQIVQVAASEIQK